MKKSDSLTFDKYELAKREWDMRCGDARVQAKNWRLFAILTLALILFLSWGIMYQMNKSSVTPFIIETLEVGTIKNKYVREIVYNPSEMSKKHFLTQFITYLRAVPTDPQVVRENWIKLSHFTTKKGGTILNQYVEENKPFDAIGKAAITIEIRSINQITDSSYRMEWIERTFQVIADEPRQTGEAVYSGTFAIKTTQPKDEKEALINPIGLYVDEYQWSKQ